MRLGERGIPRFLRRLGMAPRRREKGMVAGARGLAKGRSRPTGDQLPKRPHDGAENERHHGSGSAPLVPPVGQATATPAPAVATETLGARFAMLTAKRRRTVVAMNGAASESMLDAGGATQLAHVSAPRSAASDCSATSSASPTTATTSSGSTPNSDRSSNAGSSRLRDVS